MNVWWYLVVLIYISLIISEDECLFAYHYFYFKRNVASPNKKLLRLHVNQ
jgi:hypothetical protein